jgi:hypothetical protein
MVNYKGPSSLQCEEEPERMERIAIIQLSQTKLLGRDATICYNATMVRFKSLQSMINMKGSSMSLSFTTNTNTAIYYS